MNENSFSSFVLYRFLSFSFNDIFKANWSASSSVFKETYKSLTQVPSVTRWGYSRLIRSKLMIISDTTLRSTIIVHCMKRWPPAKIQNFRVFRWSSSELSVLNLDLLFIITGCEASYLMFKTYFFASLLAWLAPN